MTPNGSADQASDLPAALAAPARRALASAGYTSLAQLSAASDAVQLHRVNSWLPPRLTGAQRGLP